MFPTHTQEDIEKKQNEISHALNDYYERLERYPHSPRTHRYILLIGRSKAGKTTLKQMLNDPRIISNESSLISTTKEPIVDTFNISQSNLTLTVVDTPWLFNRHTYTDEPLSIDENLNKINTLCFNRGITEFHLVCFCVSFESGINNQDLEAITLFHQHFGPELSQNLCMIITRCESKNNEQRIALHSEIEHDTYFNMVVHQFGKGIHFSGALKRDDWNRGSDALLTQFENICEYRHNLLAIIEQSTTTYKITQPIHNRKISSRSATCCSWLCKFNFFLLVLDYVNGIDLFKFALSNCV
jgi:predicted GTPase